MNRANFPKFDSYACVGDSIEWTYEGYEFAARLCYDGESTPTDSECHSTEDTTRWENNKWFYVGVVLSVYKNGIELSDHAASLWGIECNFNKTSNDYLTEIALELEAEALAVAYVERARITEALTA